MPKKTNFNYLNRDFESLKTDLKGFIKLLYPDQYNDFSESSVGMMLLELNAYVGDNLAHHVDKNFNELFMETAVNRNSVIRLAKNLGYRVNGKSPAVTLLDVSINVPTDGTGYDEDYLITLQKGFRVSSDSSQNYEVWEDIDFSEHTSLSGIKNRTIDPNYNNSNEIISYKITKRVAAVAGETKYSTLEITNTNAVPYMTWVIDDEDDSIIEVLNVISTDVRTSPSLEIDWTESGSYTVWNEVESLPQERVFVDTTVSDGSEGYWKYTDKRFLSEYDEDGYMFLTFGAGVKDYDSYDDFITNGISALTLSTLLNNDSLGTIPEIGTYLHCRYRTGGGAETNAGQGTITNIVSKIVSNIPGGAGLPSATLTEVLNSLSVVNPIPAIGGKDLETIDEIKEHARGHFSSQDRCVTLDDYISRVAQLPANYGTIFRSYAESDSDSLNTRIYILTRDANGNLKNSGNDQTKFNLAAYLKNYKMLNDFIEILDGRIINLGIRFSIQVTQDQSKKNAITNCINALKEYFAIDKWRMNDTIYLSKITELLLQQPGVVNVVSLQFFNKVGGNYSTDILSTNQNLTMVQAQIIAQTGEVEIVPVNNKIRSSQTSMFEIKYPESNISGGAIT